MANRSSSSKFIEKSNKIHANNYDYSQVEYVNHGIKVKIICKIHGPFMQTPSSHLRGHGCNACRLSAFVAVNTAKKSNTYSFICKANKKHNNKYDYSKCEYITNNIKVKIICPLHGTFEQTPNSHLSGNGCPECAGKNKNTLDFIEASIKIHSTKYDYSSTVYVNSRTNLKIICPTHGVFIQLPRCHLAGNGCYKCSGRERSNTVSFINIATEIHNRKYNYSLVEYSNNSSKVKIICPTHGIFVQSPNKHLAGRGCPNCNSSKGERLIRKILIDLNIQHEPQYRLVDCVNINKLPFDFGVFHNKRICCIEYQGMQHYVPVNFGSKTIKAEHLLEKIKKRDAIKHQYCLDNNIPLLILKYDEDDLMEEKIKTFLDSL